MASENLLVVNVIIRLVMKRATIAFVFVVLAGLALSGSVSAQRNIEAAIDRDPILEQDAKHNLDVAWQSYRLKKAYKGVLMRFEETFAAYPEFSKMDEFLYLAGMSSYYLSENKGKQKVNLKLDKEKNKFAPEKLREDAVAYLALLVEKHPQSQYRDEAEETLKTLKAPTN
jgi:outer membrane protein assembly factor BamD (BamD/ComL family)